MIDIKEGMKYAVIGIGFVAAGLLLQPILAQWTKNVWAIGIALVIVGLIFAKQESIVGSLGKGVAVAGAVLLVSPMVGPVLQKVQSL